MKSVKIRRRIKNSFYRLGGHRFFSWLLNALLHFAYLIKASKWISKHRDIPFNDFYSAQRDYSKRYDLFEFINANQILADELIYLEFGVAQGKSMMWWLDNHINPRSEFHGFDTFTGLPEKWGHFEKGDMTNKDQFPTINDNRCVFHKGLFQETLPGFLNKLERDDKKMIVHLDADLYSSTLFVLTSIYPFLKSGDILLFDEFNVPLHEFKAWEDFAESYHVHYEVLAATNNYYQVAIKLK